MKLLVLGSTGFAGQALHKAAVARACRLRTVARRGADISCDISLGDALEDLLSSEQPDAVVNAAALVNLAASAEDPGLSWRINARPAGILAAWSKRSGRPFLQISTDHFFAEGGRAPHAEDAPVVLLNEYARTKYAGEAMALTAPQSLVLRTSIVGLRGWQEPSFAEWALAAVAEDREMTLFSDAWTSSLDTGTFAVAALELFLDHGTRGLVNLAAGEVYSKESFIREIAHQTGSSLTRASSGSVHDLLPGRASSLGLDVSRAEAILGYRLPGLAKVVQNILAERKDGST